MFTHLAHNPLVEVLGLRLGDGMVGGGINETLNCCDLVLLGQHGDIVLEGVGDPKTLVADVGDTLVVEPVVLLGKSLVKAVIEVLVVGENNVAADIIQLFCHESTSATCNGSFLVGWTYEAFRSHICGRETTRLLARVDDQP